MKSFVENKLLIDFQEDQKNTQIATLIDLGMEHGFVTSADILRLIPIQEDEMDTLEKVFGALLSAGLPYIEDDDQDDDPDDHQDVDHRLRYKEFPQRAIRQRLFQACPSRLLELESGVRYPQM